MKLPLTSQDVANCKRDALKNCLKGEFPETLREGQIDFDQLKRVLGEWVDPGKERFGLTWPGKAEGMSIIQQPSVATLRPVREASIDFDTAPNLFIEGDNLEVLKLVQKSYFGKVKLIYIDPPYNTGGDFIYPDNYSETLETYLAYTGQISDDGKKFSTNADTSGRYHSRWLRMMYSRLYLARNLLSEHGSIFISIDDGEVANLRKAADEIFGEDNFVANVIWQKKYTRSNDARWFSDNHDHILVYAKNKETFEINGLARSEEQLKSYANPDNHPKGPWKATPLHAKSGTNTSSFTFSNGIKWTPPIGTFRRFNDEAMRRMDDAKEIWFGSDGAQTPSRKSFLSEVKEGVTPTTIWTYQEAGHTHEANNDLKALGLGGVFDNPKPVRLIRLMLGLATTSSDGDIVLDFFAGSGTTAQAVLEQNQQDGGNRQFVCIQLPEPIEGGRVVDGKSFTKVSEITAERIRRTIARLTEGRSGELNLDAQKPSTDLGFKVFHLDKSNFMVWDGDKAASEPEEDLVQQLSLHVDHLTEENTPESMAYEILLKAGFPLTTNVRTTKLAGKDVFSVDEGSLLICLEREITLELIDALADANPLQVICLDEGFKGNDQLKANAVQTFKARAEAEESEIVFKTV
jgi:adenine-specific DNA-methyltransferase